MPSMTSDYHHNAVMWVGPGADAAEQLRRADIDATLMWLRHSGVGGAVERQRMATKLMMGSVAAQAVVLGVLSCGYCLDAGCTLCDPHWTWTRRVESMRLAFGTGNR